VGRIRTIKPETPQSESLGRISREARLLFVLLWTVADDEGRARAASRLLASLLFPYDDDAPELIDGWMGELEAEHCVVRYEVDGARYLQITKWLEHQKIDRPSKSRLPGFDEGSRLIVEPSTTDLGPRTVDQVPRTKDIRAVAEATRPSSDKAFEEFWKVYPRRDGANPKAPARKKFIAATKSGTNPAELTEAAKRYSAALAAKQQVGTAYVAQAVTWLNQQRWNDYSATAPPVEGGLSDAERKKMFEQLRGNGNGSSTANERTDLRGPSVGSCPSTTTGRQEPDLTSHDQAGIGGMDSLGALLQKSLGV